MTAAQATLIVYQLVDTAYEFLDILIFKKFSHVDLNLQYPEVVGSPESSESQCSRFLLLA